MEITVKNKSRTEQCTEQGYISPPWSSRDMPVKRLSMCLQTVYTLGTCQKCRQSLALYYPSGKKEQGICRE